MRLKLYHKKSKFLFVLLVLVSLVGVWSCYNSVIPSETSYISLVISLMILIVPIVIIIRLSKKEYIEEVSACEKFEVLEDGKTNNQTNN